jgi:hypothetical protein
MPALLAAADLPAVLAVCADGAGGGVLTLGSAGSHHTDAYLYTPLAAGLPFFAVRPAGARMGGTPVAGPGELGAALVDTGATGLLLPPAVWARAAAAINASCAAAGPGACAAVQGLLRGDCVPLGRETAALLPPLVVELAGGAVTVDALHYLRWLPDTGGMACLLLMPTDGAPGEPATVLGAALLASTEVVFDAAGGRIGFAPAAGCTGACSGRGVTARGADGVRLQRPPSTRSHRRRQQWAPRAWW